MASCAQKKLSRPLAENKNKLQTGTFFGLPCSVSGRRLPWEGRKSDTLHLFMKNHSQRQWTFKHWSLSTGRLWIFSSAKICAVVFFSLNAHVRRLNKCQVKRRKSKKYAGFLMLVLMQRSRHTVFVWFVFSLCILYIYWAVSVKWTLDFSPSYFTSSHYSWSLFLFLPHVSYIVPWLFIIFYVIVLFFLHSYSYKHVHKLCFF